jgi:putative tryptophan/tyrosine transport system substrate-binding protein
MRRLLLAFALSWLALAPVRAQEPGRIYRFGVLVQRPAALDLVRSVTLPELAKRGFVEGRNLVLDTRAGNPPEVPVLARELVALKADVIMAVASIPIDAVRAATAAIPIVMMGAGSEGRDSGALTSRPGGNATGLVILQAELDVKRFELLHEAVPGARRIAALLDPRTPWNEARRQDLQDAAAQKGVDLLIVEAAAPEAYPAAFAAMREAGSQALLVGSHPQFHRDWPELAKLSAEAGLPTMCQWREMAEEGCVLGYGPSLPWLYRRAGEYVARILLGTAPADLPIEAPAQLDFAINQKGAKALGITIPPALLARADEVIE